MKTLGTADYTYWLFYSTLHVVLHYICWEGIAKGDGPCNSTNLCDCWRWKKSYG